MLTVKSVIESVYVTDHVAAASLGVGRTAVSNWKKWGFFPTRVVVPIWEHAKERGINLDVSELPVMPKMRAGAVS